MTLLELNNVSKSFGALKVTDDVSFAVPKGQALGIIGPNGAGKSTLFNLITGNIAPDEGRVSLMGRDVSALPAMARVVLGSSSKRRAMAGKAVSSPTSKCQSKSVGITREPRGPPMLSVWPGAACAAQLAAGPSPCKANSMASSHAAASKCRGV